MNDTIRRTVRTFLQGFVGTFAVLAIPVLSSVITAAGDSTGYVRIDTTALGNAAIAGVVGGVIALVAFVQNLLEDKSGHDLLPK